MGSYGSILRSSEVEGAGAEGGAGVVRWPMGHGGAATLPPEQRE